MLGDTLVSCSKEAVQVSFRRQTLEPGGVSHLPAPHFKFQPEASKRPNERHAGIRSEAVKRLLSRVFDWGLRSPLAEMMLLTGTLSSANRPAGLQPETIAMMHSGFLAPNACTLVHRQVS